MTLLEFRQLAARVVAMEAIDPLQPFADFEELDRHHARIDRCLPQLAGVSRRLWARPASSWQDIVDRAELAKFWNRHRLSYADHHGYDDQRADMRLIDAVRVVALKPTSQVADAPFPAFEPPGAFLAWRRLHEERAALLAKREWTSDEKSDFSSREFNLERALLKEPADCSSWSDIVVRAEVTGRRRYRRAGCPWIKFEPEEPKARLAPQRAFAELMIAILELGRCPPRANLDDICWQRETRERQSKGRSRHAEIKALRKDRLT